MFPQDTYANHKSRGQYERKPWSTYPAGLRNKHYNLCTITVYVPSCDYGTGTADIESFRELRCYKLRRNKGLGSTIMKGEFKGNRIGHSAIANVQEQNPLPIRAVLGENSLSGLGFLSGRRILLRIGSSNVCHRIVNRGTSHLTPG
jgi:hypothetical protein